MNTGNIIMFSGVALIDFVLDGSIFRALIVGASAVALYHVVRVLPSEDYYVPMSQQSPCY